jgi:hypothetical protein
MGQWRLPGKLAALTIVGIALLICSCVLAQAGLQRGALPPAQFSIDLGALRLITLVIDDTKCTRPIPAGSIAAMCSPRTLFSTNRYYSGWIETQRRVAGHSVSTYRRIFVVRLPT